MTLALLLGVVFAVQLPAVQTFLGKKAMERLCESINGDITWSKVSVEPLEGFKVNDLLVRDKEPQIESDTLFFASKVSASFSLRSLIEGKGIHMRRAEVTDGYLHVVTEPRDSSSANINRIFNIKPGAPGHKPGPNVFDISKVRISNFRFRLTNLKKPMETIPAAINFSDLDVVASTLNVSSLRFTGGRMGGMVQELRLKEKSGYEAKLTGRAIAGMGKAEIKDIRILDQWSNVNVPQITFIYADAKAFSDFVDEVLMDINVGKSLLSFNSLGYFAHTLKPAGDVTLNINKCRGTGYVRDLYVTADCNEAASGVKAKASCRLVGLPEKKADLYLNGDVSSLTFDANRLNTLVKKVSPESKADFSKLARGETFEFTGRINGLLSKLSATGHLRETGQIGGDAYADIEIGNISRKDAKIEIAGSVSTKDFHIGALSGSDLLGRCTVRASAKAMLGPTPSVKIDTLKIDRLGVKGYDYSGIAAVGKYSQKAFDGKIICTDPNLNFIFQGIFNLSNKTDNALYKFYANLAYADLAALNLDTRGGTSKIACQLSAGYMLVGGRKDMIGDIGVRNLMLENDEGRHEIGDITIDSHSNDEIHRIQLNSEFLDAGFVGNHSIAQLWNDIQNISSKKDLTALYPEGEGEPDGDEAEYDISLRFHDSRKVLSFIKPGLYIADSTSVNLGITKEGALSGAVQSPRLALGTNYIKGVDLSLDNTGHCLNAILTGKEIKMAGVKLFGSKLSALANDNTFSADFGFDGTATEGGNIGKISLEGDLSRDATDTLSVNMRTLPSFIRFADKDWTFKPSEITIRAGNISVNDFSISCDNHSIALNGRVSPTTKDTLALKVGNIGMETINLFLKERLDISGSLSGRGIIISPTKGDMQMMASFESDSLRMGGEDAGKINLAGKWDAATGKFNAIAKNVIGGRKALDIKAALHPSSKQTKLIADMDSFRVASASPFLKSIFTKMGGYLDGHIEADGKFGTKMNFSSSGTRFRDTRFKLAYTNVEYILDGPFEVRGNGLQLNAVHVADLDGGTGTLNGGITFGDDFDVENMRLDAFLKVNSLEAIAIRESPDGDAFYGNARTTGDIRITGPISAMEITADLATTGTGDIHIPIGSANAAKSSDILTFKEKDIVTYIDPYEDMIKSLAKTKRKSATDFHAKCKLAPHPELKAFIEIDKAAGNVLSATGSGLITVDLQPKRDIFSLGGNYNIAGGNFHFEVPGIVKKDFTIKDGSSVNFGGDIQDSDLDINAVYSLKTSLGNILADSTSVSSRRLVEAGIRISDKLRNPHIDFSIDVPDLDPLYRGLFENAINTEDKLQKQFIALLVMGSFLPSEQSGVVNSSNILLSNVSEVMSNQLSNILQRLDIPLDLGVAYQQNKLGTNIFDVAVSTQLFNNRVVVNGSVGNRKYSDSSRPNGDIVGDLDIEVKLDRPGRIRLKLFSHSADEMTNYLDHSQRNGVGVTYQKEFSKFKDFFRTVFAGKKKRMEIDSEIEDREKEKITITLDNE